MLVNQTVGGTGRRAMRTTTDSSMKKCKKPRQEPPVRRKLRSATADSGESKPRREQSIPLKKERKKRAKKVTNDPEQEIIITQSIEAAKNTDDALDAMQIKHEDDLVNHCSLLDTSSLSHQMFDPMMDHNQFWQHHQLIAPTGYYLPVSSSPFDHQSNASYHLSPSDIDNSNSPMHESTAKSIHSNHGGQSRKDKSLGLLCQR
jgi:hypothetical protein